MSLLSRLCYSMKLLWTKITIMNTVKHQNNGVGSRQGSHLTWNQVGQGIWLGWVKLRPCNTAIFYSASFSKPNPVWFGKVTPKNCVRFSKPIPIWFGKKKIDFARRSPNQIQIGLENFDDHSQCAANYKPNLVWFGKIIIYCQPLEPWTNSSFIL